MNHGWRAFRITVALLVFEAPVLLHEIGTAPLPPGALWTAFRVGLATIYAVGIAGLAVLAIIAGELERRPGR